MRYTNVRLPCTWPYFCCVSGGYFSARFHRHSCCLLLCFVKTKTSVKRPESAVRFASTWNVRTNANAMPVTCWCQTSAAAEPTVSLDNSSIEIKALEISGFYSFLMTVSVGLHLDRSKFSGRAGSRLACCSLFASPPIWEWFHIANRILSLLRRYTNQHLPYLTLLLLRVVGCFSVLSLRRSCCLLFVALSSQHLQRGGVMYLTDGQLVEISNGSNCILGQISSKKCWNANWDCLPIAFKFQVDRTCFHVTCETMTDCSTLWAHKIENFAGWWTSVHLVCR